MFELGIISDEIGQDFEQSCKLIREWGLSHVEIRTMWGKNILELTEPELKQVDEIITKYNLTVTAIASPIFKSPRDSTPRDVEGDFQLSGFEDFDGQLKLIRKAAELCKRFKTDKIRIFTFWREPWTVELAQDVADKLIEATTVARDLDVILAVENEPVCVVGNGKELAALFDVIRQKAAPDILDHIGILWDPGNASHGGEEIPFPDGYALLQKDEIIHIHLKDTIVDAEGHRKLVPLGVGTIDYEEQLRQLKADRFSGVLVLEPHYHPDGMSQEDAALACVRAAQESLHAAFA